MFRTILRRELQRNLSSSTLLFAIVALTILVLLSAYTQGRYYQRLVEDYTLRQNIRQIENSGQAIVLIRSLPPLLPFFNGVYDSLPDEFRLQSDTVIMNPLSGDLAPLDWLFPKVDLSFIIGVLMTLLTILLAHDAIALDREQGALKLILAGPVRRRAVLAAKLTGVILLMTIILIYVTLLYATVASLFSGGTVDLSGSNLSVLAVSTLMALLLFMAVASLGVAISASARRSLVSLSLCAFIWMAVVLIWPSLGPYIASSFKTVSLREAAQRDIALKERELIQAELDEQRRTAADLKAQNVGVEFAWRRHLELRRKWMERRNVEIGRLVEERKKQLRDQQIFARRIMSFSPYVAFKEALGHLCGTGLESYDDLLAAVERYGRQEFLPASLDMLSRQKPWLNAAMPDDRAQLPPFQTPSPALSERLAAAAWPLGVLIAEIIILLMVGVLGFERCDVRRSRKD